MPRNKPNIHVIETEATLMFNRAVEQYLVYQQEQQRLSKTTLSHYRAGLRRFAKSLPPDSTLIEVTPQLMRRYLLTYAQSHHPASVYQVASALRSLSAYLREQGWWLDDPCKDLPLPKKQKPQRRTLKDAEVQNLLLSCERISGEFQKARARAVFCILIYGGLRRQEMLDLEIADVELASGKVTIRHGKGDKHRIVYIPPSAVRAIRDWLHVRPHESPHSYLFCANRRYRLGAGALKGIFEQVWAIAGYADKSGIWCHALRHAAATRLLRNGATLADIQAFLGHEDMKTTQIYLHTDDEQLRKLAGLVEFAPAQAIVEAKGSRREGQRSRRVELQRG